MNDQLLFNQYDIFSVIEARRDTVKKRVQEIPPNTILGASEQDIIQAHIGDLRLTVPTIKDDEIHIAQSGETQVDVSRDPMRFIRDRSRPFYIQGNETVIAVPFEGDETFFRVQPQSFSLSPPRAEIGKGELRLTFIRTDPNAEEIKRSYQATVNSIKEYLRSLSDSATRFNSELVGQVTQLVQARKQRLLADANMTAALGLPMRKREGAPTTYAIPVNRRTPRIDQIKVNETFKPEPSLSTEDYQEILRIMTNMVEVMERSPHAFSEMGEEDLRSHFLVQLNGAFQGRATGETFNFQGKTDILIREQGKNVFIAECKFWKGEKALIDTVDQLLSYLSWRDTKTAVLVFNRNANFSAVLAKIVETMPQHKNFKRDLGKKSESAFQYIFGQPNDANREIVLTVMAFDIPTVPPD
jgi:hypothetical protein